jgi:transcriptional regulator with XRE-family HTH domain
MTRYLNFLKAYRQHQGLKQRKLAELLDVDAAYVSSWETGKTLPTLETREKICEILREPLEKIFP